MRHSRVSDDSLTAAMFRLMPKSLEETVMFANEDEGFQELFDRLLAYSSTKLSVRMSEIKRQNRRGDPMEVDRARKALLALERGKVKTACGMLCAGTVASLATMRKTVNRSGHKTKKWSGKKCKSKG